MADYPIVILPLSEQDGGGYLGFAPDLKGCASDGETREEAVRNTEEAIRDWLEECRRLGRELPAPGHAVERARTDRRALLDAVKALAEISDDRGRRIKELVEAIEEIRDRSAHDLPWYQVLDVCGEERRSKLALVKH